MRKQYILKYQGHKHERAGEVQSSQFLADQLILLQLGVDFAHHIICPPPGLKKYLNKQKKTINF